MSRQSKPSASSADRSRSISGHGTCANPVCEAWRSGGEVAASSAATHSSHSGVPLAGRSVLIVASYRTLVSGSGSSR
jgi:hypothetical protein